MDGILNIWKSAGMTSFDVVAKLRKIYGERRIGHGGTLDPLATGVLPIFMGRATRLIEYASMEPKVYEAEFRMGVATDTEDTTGKVVSVSEEKPREGIWERVIPSFCGSVLQTPSAYSAIHVKGCRAYELARKGESVSLLPRRVHIFDMTIRSACYPFLRLSVTCSSGTYIRALGRDLGKAAGIPLTLSSLARMRMGMFDLKYAHSLDEVEASPAEWMETNLETAVAALPSISLSEQDERDFLWGKRIACEVSDAKAVAVRSSRFLGVGVVKAGVLHPKKVFL